MNAAFFCLPRAPAKRRRSGAGSSGVARLQRSAGPLCRTILATRRLLPSYNKTYGSFGAVIDLTTWKWLSSIVILLRAELNADNGAPHSIRHDAGPRASKGCEERGCRTQSGEKRLGAQRPAANILLSSRGRKRLPLPDIQTRMY